MNFADVGGVAWNDVFGSIASYFWTIIYHRLTLVCLYRANVLGSHPNMILLVYSVGGHALALSWCNCAHSEYDAHIRSQ